MSLSDWIITLTVLITIVPLIKMAKEKRFGSYNIIVVIVGITILILSILKNRNDESIYAAKERLIFISDSTNTAEIKQLSAQSRYSKYILSKITSSLDSLGLKIENGSGRVMITDSQVLKKIILTAKSSTNVTSVNQQGGQTARDITNNN